MNWKTITEPSINGRLYEISDTGRVRLTYDLPLMKANGYRFAALRIKGKRRNFAVHRLVANAFIPNPLNKPFVNHIDANPSNNCVENLEWVTPKENTQHAVKLGRIQKGEAHHGCTITDEAVMELYEELKTGDKTMEMLSEKYGISPPLVSAIWRTKGNRNKAFADRTVPTYKAKNRKPPPKKLPQEIYDSIHVGLLNGESKSSISRRLGVSKQCVFRFCKRMKWGTGGQVTTPTPQSP